MPAEIFASQSPTCTTKTQASQTDTQYHTNRQESKHIEHEVLCGVQLESTGPEMRVPVLDHVFDQIRHSLGGATVGFVSQDGGRTVDGICVVAGCR